MTFESKDVIQEMLRHDGRYPGDPQAFTIWRYVGGMNGKTLYAVFMNEFNDMYESPYVHYPVLLWTRDFGLTEEGQKEIT